MWDPDRTCVVVDIKGPLFTVTHLVIIDGEDTVKTKCRRTAPREDSYTATYGNVTCRVCRR